MKASEIPTSNELQRAFGEALGGRYYDIIPFSQGAPGFSIKRAYPDDIMFHPVKNPDGSVDSVILIKVGCGSKASGRYPLRILVGHFSRYLQEHFDYGDDEKSPTEAELRAMRQSVQPLEIRSIDEYFIAADLSELRRSDGRSLKPSELFDELVDLHLAPTQPIRGGLVRAHRRIHGWKIRQLTHAEAVTKFVLEKIFGRTLVEPIERFAFLRGYRAEDLRLTQLDSFDFCGYRASKRSILIFAVLSLILCFSLHFYEKDRDLQLFDHTLFTAAFSVVGLAIIEGPLILATLGLLNFWIDSRRRLLERTFVVKRRSGLFVATKAKD